RKGRKAAWEVLEFGACPDGCRDWNFVFIPQCVRDRSDILLRESQTCGEAGLKQFRKRFSEEPGPKGNAQMK
ncbi:hypothetical protein, partial [Flavobacterium sp. ENC]|uniref:hypothetical protein n=1 Tax=Flavobacterium sp. ENC TaxID=2897330 RepID=UPI001E3CA973